MDERTSHSIQIDLETSYPEIRELIRKICARFPGEYWRKLEEAQAYPESLLQH
jgi:acyl-CoA dehydrogenase